MSVVLGIESTCDETAASVVVNGKEILSNIITSQMDLLELYGGVYPELACRRHFDVILPVIEEALKSAKAQPSDIDLIAVASKPGLMGALLIGVNVAKSLAYAWEKPFVGVNHIEAHLYSALMELENPTLPAIGIVASGGHTSLVQINGIGEYELIGQTIDDAVGESFDKVARLMDLPFPGGPEIEKLAKEGDRKSYPFKAGNVKGQPLNFSFSGLKTQLLYTLKGQNGTPKSPTLLDEKEKKNVAASFQEVALTDIVKKALKAAKKLDIKTIYIGGGVSNNQRFREIFNELCPDLNVFWPPRGLSIDNAAMIAGLGYHVFKKRGRSDPLSLSPTPTSKLLSL